MVGLETAVNNEAAIRFYKQKGYFVEKTVRGYYSNQLDALVMRKTLAESGCRNPFMKIAIQGELGSFSHEAAETMLPRAKVVPCARSLEVFDRVKRGSVDGAVIPIENSLAGSVAEHFDLVLSRDVHIAHEFRLRIVHNLIALPG